MSISTSSVDVLRVSAARALFLPERAADVRSNADTSTDADLALHVSEWKRDARLDDGLFDAKLASEGYDAAVFAALIAPPLPPTVSAGPTATPAQVAPDWLHELLHVFAQWPSITAQTRAAAVASGMSFAPALAAFVQSGMARLQRALPTDTPFLIDHDTVFADLCCVLFRRLTLLAERVLVLELNVARLQQRLAGDTGEARFQSYLRLLSESPAEWLQLFDEYPLLARRLATVLGFCVRNVAEIVHQLVEDWPAVSATLLEPATHYRLRTLHFSASDAHRQGRGVAMLQLQALDGEASAAPRCIVYKPRSIEVEQRFQALLVWFNARCTAADAAPSNDVASAALPFRITAMVSGAGRGWVEFIEHAGCTDVAALRRFYRRQGALLALLHLIGGADFHQENLIASGEHPVMVDLEALFHAAPAMLDDGTANTRALRFLAESVTRVGLLPHRIWGDARTPGVDISGLGTAAPQRSPQPWPMWSGSGTDGMRQVKQHVLLLAWKNLPSLHGRPAQASDFSAELTAGFATMCARVIEARPALLAADGPIRAFAAVEVRHIARPTMLYGQILRDASHPDTLRDARDCERLLDTLWLLSRHRPELVRLIAAEKQDLREHDVPMFTTQPDSSHLRDSRGTLLRDYFATDTLSRVIARIEALDATAIAGQVRMIRASLSASIVGHGALAVPMSDARASPGNALSPAAATTEAMLAAAAHIGTALADQAIFGDDDVTWLGMSYASDEHWQLRAVGSGLYDGIAGIALVFAWLARLDGRAQFVELSTRATRSLVRSVERRDEAGIGGFSGLTAQLHILTHLALLDEDATLFEVVRAALDEVETRVAKDDLFDVLAGSAGAIVALLGYHAASDDDRALDLALACANHLAAHALPMPTGVAWKPSHQSRPLLGFSHGNAGIAWALRQLVAALRERGTHAAQAREFAALAESALAYERHCFDAQHRNWPDFRKLTPSQTPTDGPVFFCAWCHGAPGIALARLPRQAQELDVATRAEIERAVELTIAAPLLGDHSLCHGEIGNLLIARKAATRLQRADWHARLDRRLSDVLADLQRHGARCGVPGGYETPGLMTGLAGIGLGLLRLAYPDRVPDVMTLELPIRRDRVETARG